MSPGVKFGQHENGLGNAWLKNGGRMSRGGTGRLSRIGVFTSRKRLVMRCRLALLLPDSCLELSCRLETVGNPAQRVRTLARDRIDHYHEAVLAGPHLSRATKMS